MVMAITVAAMVAAVTAVAVVVMVVLIVAVVMAEMVEMVGVLAAEHASSTQQRGRLRLHRVSRALHQQLEVIV